MSAEELLNSLRPVLQVLKNLEAGRPAQAAEVLLAQDHSAIIAAAKAAAAEGWLVNREAGPHVRFGRLAKATPESLDFSIDAVIMDGPAPGPHTHLSGEFDLCIPLEGQPRFDGHAETWVVYAPGSRHIPTVTGGKMLILYFVPGGQIRFA
jgi:hypothetical protein